MAKLNASKTARYAVWAGTRPPFPDEATACDPWGYFKVY